ncbi:MAG: class D sortase [Thermoanaerobaculia bacterium]
MTIAANRLRPIEIALAFGGIVFLGGAFAATVHRVDYQAQQERAIVHHVDGAVVPARGEVAVDPLVIGRIEIPRVGVRAIVREGTDDRTLALAVGHLSGTAVPGGRGNAVLAGHRDTFFRGLRDIRIHDEVRLLVPPVIYEYRVESVEVIPPEDTRVLDDTKDETLTLVTCFPFSYIGHAPNRFIVHAARVESTAGDRASSPHPPVGSPVR